MTQKFHSLIALALFWGASSFAQAPFAVDGHLVNNGVGVDDVFDFDVVVRDSEGSAVVEFTEFGVVVVAGDFAFALDDDAVAAALEAGDLVVEVSVAALGLTAPAALGAVPVVATTETATLALTAQSATTLGSSARADLVTATQLATVGGASVSDANVTARPAGIDDGDQGTIDSVGAGLVRSGTAVDVANGAVTSAKIVDGTVGTAAIADAAVTASQLPSVVASNFASATLATADFANAGLTSADVSGNLRTLFQLPPGCNPAVPLTTSSSSCTKRAGCPAGQQPNCFTNLCEVSNTSQCAVTRVGQLLFAP